jgi:hypothetical protein
MAINYLLDDAMRELRQRLPLGRPSVPGGYSVGPTAGQFGMMSQRGPTAEEQGAFNQRNAMRSEYGRAWQGGGLSTYAGGIKQRMMEAEKQKAAIEARRNALQDKHAAEENARKERETAIKEQEFELKKQEALGGTGTAAPQARQADGAALTKGVPAGIQNLPQTGPTGKAETLPNTGQETRTTPLNQVPTQTGPSAFPPETGSFNTPGGRIVVPEESAKNDPMLKAGTWLMNGEGKIRRIYGEPKPSLGDDPFAYTPNVPPPVVEKNQAGTVNAPVVNPNRQLQPPKQGQNTVMGDIGRTAADMFYRAPMNAIGQENIEAAANTARDMFVSPIQNALTIPEGQKEFRLNEAKKKRESLWKGMDWLSKYVLGGVR